MDGATFLPDDLVECRVAECACFRRRLEAGAVGDSNVECHDLAPQLVKPLKLFNLSLTGTPRRWCCAQKRHGTWCICGRSFVHTGRVRLYSLSVYSRQVSLGHSRAGRGDILRPLAVR